MKIVSTIRYLRDLKKLKASAADVDALERMIVANPLAGAIIPGLRGVRKIRFRIGNRSKASGGRAIYYIIVSEDTALMITVYAKAEKEDLSADDKKAILRVLEEFKQ